MYFRQISGDGVHFGFPFGFSYTLAFSRILYGREVLVCYNVAAEPRRDSVVVDASLHQAGDTLRYLYGKTGSVSVERAPDGRNQFATPSNACLIFPVGCGTGSKVLEVDVVCAAI
jgi:hypothetical protein